MSITRTIPDIRTLQLAESMRSSLEELHGTNYPLWVPALSAHPEADQFALHIRTSAHHSIDLQVKQEYPSSQFSVTYLGHEEH